MNRLKRELGYVVLLFWLPMMVLVGFDIWRTPTEVPAIRRLVTLEDTCPYFGCVLVGILVYIVARPTAHLVTEWRARSRAEE